MKNTVCVKAAALLLLLAGLTVRASAQVTVSGGFALSQMDASGEGFGSVVTDTGIGGNVYVDYLLPINIPLSVGGEIGVDTAAMKMKHSGLSYKDTITTFPILARVAYHFDLMPELDLYVVGKIGISIGLWTGDYIDSIEDQNIDIKTPPGFAFGFDVGAAYYFMPTVGAFVEAGFDRYDREVEFGRLGSADVPFNRFLTFGISVKF
ncbi:MAG: outer membrane beta-barrel protein [Treponema sp.]|nr:outer membrane beta-barrel protein [Treponema sp.]